MIKMIISLMRTTFVQNSSKNAGKYNGTLQKASRKHARLQ